MNKYGIINNIPEIIENIINFILIFIVLHNNFFSFESSAIINVLSFK